MTKKTKIEELLKTPVLDVNVCICCGEPIEPSIDKRGHSFIRCSTCGTTIFFRNDRARIGFTLSASVVEKNIRKHKALLEERYHKFMDERKLLIPR